MTVKSEFLHTLQTRGFLQDCTALEEMDAAMQKGVLPGYLGFDLTADSLHVGSLVQIMLLRWLQKTGHKPVVLMGGGTTRIGDPSGKDEARQLLTSDAIAANMAGIRKIFDVYMTFGDGPSDAVMANNADWLDELNYIDFLRDYGRHFTINRMLTFDSVKLRLDREQPLTFLEFNYMLLQAYDFLELHRRHGVGFQMGGSDQWGNIINGVELCRRVERAQVFGVTTPLITKADGSKMGKSASGAIWLNEDRLSHFDFWQFWRNTADADVGRFLKLFTEIDLEEINRLEALEGAELNEAKAVLADHVTTLARGEGAASAARAAAKDVFEAGGPGADLPTVEIDASDVGHGITVAQVFVRAGLVSSGKQAKRLVADGGARLNGEPETDAGRMLVSGDLDGLMLSAGRKRHAKVALR